MPKILLNCVVIILFLVVIGVINFLAKIIMLNINKEQYLVKINNFNAHFPEEYNLFAPIGWVIVVVYVAVLMFGGSIALLPIDGIENYVNLIAFCFLFCCFAILGSKFLKQNIFGLKENFKNKILYSIVSYGILIITMVLVVFILSKGFGITNDTAYEDNTKIPWILETITIAFFAPFVEEMVFRAVIFRWLAKSSIILANILSALAFAWIHCIDYVVSNQDYSQLVATLPLFFVGVCLNIIYTKTGSIYYPMIIHMIHNFIF